MSHRLRSLVTMTTGTPNRRTVPKTGSELRRSRAAVGLSQFRLAQMLGMTNGQLSELERTDARLSESVRTSVEKVLMDWNKPRKRSPGSGRKKVTPKAPGIETDCCGQLHDSTSSTGPTALALFSGCGGFAAGFREAGYNIVGFVELDRAARASFKANFPESKCWGHSIEEFSQRVVEGWNQEIDVLIGGPPCQGFSLAGKRDPSDPRNSLFEHLVLAADKIRPKVIVMENVRLLLTMRNPNGKLVIDEIRRQFQSIHYSVQVWTLNSADYGVPQVRERVFIVASRDDVESPSCPTPTHYEGSSPTLDARKPWRTFRDATSDLDSLESGESSEVDKLHWAVSHPDHVIDWLRVTPEGQSAHDNTDTCLRPPSGYNTTYKRLRWDEPSSTIGTTFGMISGSRNVHPSDTRSLTIREAARCQSFPDSYSFQGTWSEIRTMIGNAVPPGLSRVVGDVLRRSLNQKSTNSASLK
jgi:DNA (cytosine-5)-methyltransferase 1